MEEYEEFTPRLIYENSDIKGFKMLNRIAQRWTLLFPLSFPQMFDRRDEAARLAQYRERQGATTMSRVESEPARTPSSSWLKIVGEQASQRWI